MIAEPLELKVKPDSFNQSPAGEPLPSPMYKSFNRYVEKNSEGREELSQEDLNDRKASKESNRSSNRLINKDDGEYVNGFPNQKIRTSIQRRRSTPKNVIGETDDKKLHD